MLRTLSVCILRTLPGRFAAVAACALLAAGPTARSGAAAVERAVLSNGITVIAKQDASSDVAGVKLLVKAGQEHEGPERAGIRTLIGEMLLKRLRERLEERAELEPLRRQQDASAEQDILNTGTHWGYSELQGAVTSDALPDCLRLMAWAAFESEFTQEHLVRARDALNATREQSLERDPVRQTYLLLRKALTGESRAAVSLLGTEEALAGLSLDDVVEFRKRAYGPSNTCVAVVSPLPPDDAVALVRGVFEQFPAGPRLSDAELLSANAAEVEVEGSRDLLRLGGPDVPPPASLMIGVPVPPPSSPDAVVAEVVSAVLGRPGGTLARDEELAKVLAFAEMSPQNPVETLLIPAGVVAPHMTIHAFCDAYEIEATKAALMGHLKRLQTEAVTQPELEEAKAFLINESARERGTKLDQAELLAKSEVLGSGYDYAESFARRVAEVSPDDIQRVAKQYFGRPALAVQLPVSP